MSISQALAMVGRPIAYYPEIAKALKSHTTAIFLCQFLYWKDKGSDPEGWIYKTYSEIRGETGLSERDVDNSRNQLKELGIMEDKLKGIPAKLHYKFNWDILDEYLLNYFGQKKESSKRKPSRPVSTDRPNKKAGNVPANYTETTTENTSENTTKGDEGEKSPSDYQICMKYYFDFYEHVLKLPQPNITDVEGKKLKEIIKYMDKAKMPGTETPDTLRFIFARWKTLSPWLQKKIRLAEIHQFLVNILDEIRNGSANNKTKSELNSYEESLRNGQ